MKKCNDEVTQQQMRYLTEMARKALGATVLVMVAQVDDDDQVGYMVMMDSGNDAANPETHLIHGLTPLLKGAATTLNQLTTGRFELLTHDKVSGDYEQVLTGEGVAGVSEVY
jgi:hypothetical protein